MERGGVMAQESRTTSFSHQELTTTSRERWRKAAPPLVFLPHSVIEEMGQGRFSTRTVRCDCSANASVKKMSSPPCSPIFSSRKRVAKAVTFARVGDFGEDLQPGKTADVTMARGLILIFSALFLPLLSTSLDDRIALHELVPDVPCRYIQ